MGTVVVGLQEPDGDDRRSWYVRDMGKVQGPMSINEIRKVYAKGTISPLAKVREESWPDWRSIMGLFLAQHHDRMEADMNRRMTDVFRYRYLSIFVLGGFLYLFGMYLFIWGRGSPVGFAIVLLSFFVEATGIAMDRSYALRTGRMEYEYKNLVLIMGCEFFFLGFLVYVVYFLS
jgi:hypothetical protein